MRAERDRRAAILTAEGVKQSQILTAEGEKQSAVLKAEGAKTSAILRSEGEAKAIDTVFNAIHAGRPDRELLSYQYLQMLPAARAGVGEQDLRDPERVLPGAVQPRPGGQRARERRSRHPHRPRCSRRARTRPRRRRPPRRPRATPRPRPRARRRRSAARRRHHPSWAARPTAGARGQLGPHDGGQRGGQIGGGADSGRYAAAFCHTPGKPRFVYSDLARRRSPRTLANGC